MSLHIDRRKISEADFSVFFFLVEVAAFGDQGFLFMKNIVGKFFVGRVTWQTFLFAINIEPHPIMFAPKKYSHDLPLAQLSFLLTTYRFHRNQI